jgi:hypothetical protein
MKSSKTIMLLSLGALALAPILGPSGAMAQAARPGFVGTTPSTVAGCPAVMWRVARDGNNVNGIAYYTDLSGLSHVTGTADQATGKFTLVLTSVMGSGPVGTVTGQRSAAGANQAQGALEADLKGPGCANVHVNMKPVLDLNTYGGTG